VKFFELDLSNSRKVRKNTWDKEYYLYVNINHYLVDGYGTEPSFDIDQTNDWEYYVEPKQKKKYWLWKVTRTALPDKWFKTDVYLDEEGLDTSGINFWKDWKSMPKIKCEDDFVEV
jgi:hypothetical protein